MKKVLTLLAIMAIAMGVVFAAEGTGSGSTTSQESLSGVSATLEATLDLTEEQYTQYFEIGFTGSAVSYETGSNNALPEIEPITTVPLEVTEGGEAQNTDGSAHVYWIIKGNTSPVTVSLTTGAAMAKDGGKATIAWKASATPITVDFGDEDAETVTSGVAAVTSSSNTTNPGSPVTVATIDNPTSSKVVAGSTALSISTVGLLTTTVGNAVYSGTLTLNIAAN